jgi:hypothetical protein
MAVISGIKRDLRRDSHPDIFAMGANRAISRPAEFQSPLKGAVPEGAQFVEALPIRKAVVSVCSAETPMEPAATPASQALPPGTRVDFERGRDPRLAAAILGSRPV